MRRLLLTTTGVGVAAELSLRGVQCAALCSVERGSSRGSWPWRLPWRLCRDTVQMRLPRWEEGLRLVTC